jgi:endonuclease-3
MTARDDVRRVSGTPEAPVAAPSGRTIAAVMVRLGTAIRAMEQPAVEKISEEQEGTPFHVLVATMLSAQTRDEVTHRASTQLFAVAGTPHALAALPERRIERLIYPVSFYRAKARHVRQTAGIIARNYGGRVPETMDELLALPGVGRKTANLVLIVAHGSAENICVDTHVHRISNRLGWVRTRTPEQTELALYDVAPRRWWSDINLHLVTWGQNVCKPVYPRCGNCAINRLCPKIGVTLRAADGHGRSVSLNGAR